MLDARAQHKEVVGEAPCGIPGPDGHRGVYAINEGDRLEQSLPVLDPGEEYTPVHAERLPQVARVRPPEAGAPMLFSLTWLASATLSPWTPP